MAVRKVIGLHAGDTLEARAEQGTIVLAPQTLQDKQVANRQGIRSILGAGKHCRNFSTSQEVDGFIRHLRDEWT